MPESTPRPALPWRQRTTPLPAPEATKAKDDGFVAVFLKPLVVPVVLAVVAFYSGQMAEQNKQHDQDRRLAVENRRRLFVGTAQDFGMYVTHWNRLRSVTVAQTQLQVAMDDAEARLRDLQAKGRRASPDSKLKLAASIKELKEERRLADERKERYVKGRDDAKDRLSGSFEQARLFFGEPTIAALAEYEAFDRLHGAKRIPELPPMDEWRRLATVVFNQMRVEIRHDEERLQSPDCECLAAR